MSLFPMFLKLEGRVCLVVGAGRVGESKIRSLVAAGAKVRTVAPVATPTVANWDRLGVVTWDRRAFDSADLGGAFLVVAATSSCLVNDLIFREAGQRGILCNVVDDPERCDFYYPAVVRRGDLQIAISTAGRSPALAQRLRRSLALQFPARCAGWVSALGREREILLGQSLDPEYRRQLLHEMASGPVGPGDGVSREIRHGR